MSETQTEKIFDTIEEAIADVALGRPVIVTDDEGRENEGDLIVAASKISPETVNMMILHARGLICAPCAGHHLHSLGITSMVRENRESHKTDFTVSIDAAEGITTGISAYDRFRTIQLLGDPETRPDDFVQPGHIFPLKARDGGVLERAGHTEAAVDLASLAGLFPAAVICEILNEDGTMSRQADLFEFKKKFGLKMISIADLIEYRRRSEKLVSLIHEEPFESEFGTFTLKVFKSKVDGREHLAFVAGELDDEPALVRVHGENLFSDLFRKKGGRGHEGLDAAFKKISQEGKGAVVYLQRDDSGLSSGLRGESSSNGGDMGLREYGIGAQILVALGLKKIRLLSNTERNVVGLDGYDLEITERVSL